MVMIKRKSNSCEYKCVIVKKLVWMWNDMSESAVCRCKHTRLYHMFTTIKNVKDGRVTPVVFCLDCDCSNFIMDKQKWISFAIIPNVIISQIGVLKLLILSEFMLVIITFWIYGNTLDRKETTFSTYLQLLTY
jgi:hypothetical protein